MVILLKVWFYSTNEDLLQPCADPGGGQLGQAQC